MPLMNAGSVPVQRVGNDPADVPRLLPLAADWETVFVPDGFGIGRICQYPFLP